jgi:kynurenine formamidase
MKAVDLSHPFSMHTPGWVDYPSPKISYFQRHATNGIVSQFIETPLHVSTHMDGEMHAVSGGRDIASMPLDRLFRDGVIVDISDDVDDFSLIKPEHIESKADVREGDILIYHTGYHKYYNEETDEDEVRYFCKHPGGGTELAQWIVDKKLAWTGFDCGSADHPMNTSIRWKRPDVRREYERAFGVNVDEQFPEENLFVMHRIPFKQGIVHAENVGGDIDQVLNRRCKIGAFPWKFRGGEASICRIVAFLED